MKALLFIIAAILLGGDAFGHEQSKRFRSVYESRGDKFMEVLYWLPETREIFRSHIPNHGDWVGFEGGYWKDVPADTRLKILDELGSSWDELDADAVDRGWKRIIRWDLIARQLEVMVSFIDGEEAFLSWAYRDELLRPAFVWLTNRRPKGFAMENIGDTFATGEHVLFRPILIERLLDSSLEQQFSCFSRFYQHLTAIEKNRAEQ